MLTQKLYRNGNSVAVTIPKEYLEELRLKEGTKVSVKMSGQNLIVSPQRKTLAKDVDQKFMKMVDEFINEHEDVLRELSKR